MSQNQPKMNPNPENLLSRRQVAKRWGVSGATVRRREKSGMLHPIVLGPRLIRYRLSEIEAIERDGLAS